MLNPAIKSAAFLRNDDHGNPIYKVEFQDSYRPTDALSTFGFHSGNTVPLQHRKNVWVWPTGNNDGERVESAKEKALSEAADRCEAIFRNLYNILGYLPGIGIIILLIRLHCSQNDPKSAKTAHYVRGAFEALGLGACYLLPDLFVTAHRFLRA